jgi:hypothetical protein
MKVTKRLTGLMIVGAVALVIGACGKQTQTPYSILGSNYTYGSCDATATGENVYDGEMQINNDSPLGYNYNSITSGSVKLYVIPTNGQVNSYTASALLTMSGSQYCCTTQGIGGVFGLPATEDEKATISGLTLICQSTGANTGYFGSSYQAITLKIGVPVQVSTWENGEAVLDKEQRLRGWIQISSGVQNIGNISNQNVYYVE